MTFTFSSCPSSLVGGWGLNTEMSTVHAFCEIERPDLGFCVPYKVCLLQKYLKMCVIQLWPPAPPKTRKQGDSLELKKISDKLPLPERVCVACTAAMLTHTHTQGKERKLWQSFIQSPRSWDFRHWNNSDSPVSTMSCCACQQHEELSGVLQWLINYDSFGSICDSVTCLLVEKKLVEIQEN